MSDLRRLSGISNKRDGSFDTIVHGAYLRNLKSDYTIRGEILVGDVRRARQSIKITWTRDRRRRRRSIYNKSTHRVSLSIFRRYLVVSVERWRKVESPLTFHVRTSSWRVTAHKRRFKDLLSSTGWSIAFVKKEDFMKSVFQSWKRLFLQ